MNYVEVEEETAWKIILFRCVPGVHRGRLRNDDDEPRAHRTRNPDRDRRGFSRVSFAARVLRDARPIGGGGGGGGRIHPPPTSARGGVGRAGGRSGRLRRFSLSR